MIKLNAAGNNIIGSKKIGGIGNDGVNITSTRGLTSLQRNYGDDGRSEVILDAAGNIYVASTTQSIDFPVSASAFQTASGGLQDGERKEEKEKKKREREYVAMRWSMM